MHVKTRVKVSLNIDSLLSLVSKELKELLADCHMSVACALLFP